MRAPTSDGPQAQGQTAVQAFLMPLGERLPWPGSGRCPGLPRSPTSSAGAVRSVVRTVADGHSVPTARGEVILPPTWLILLRLDRSCRAQLGAVVHWGEKCGLCGSWRLTALEFEGRPPPSRRVLRGPTGLSHPPA